MVERIHKFVDFGCWVQFLLVECVYIQCFDEHLIEVVGHLNVFKSVLGIVFYVELALKLQLEVLYLLIRFLLQIDIF